MQEDDYLKRMDNRDNNFLAFLSENDPHGLLNHKPKKSKLAQRTVLLNNFEEIVDFFEEHHREPKNTTLDIKEFQLFCRLKAIRENASMVKELKEFDFNGLLESTSISDIPFEDILKGGPLNLLDSGFDDSIFSLDHVKKNERIAPEYIARRRFCQDFDKYQPLFDSLKNDLEKGTRKLAVYHSEDLKPEKFYVLGGIILYLKSVNGNVDNYNYPSGDRARYDGRTECIFDNGTTSDMLYRSLDKALQKEGYSISEYDETRLSVDEVTDKDIACGYVYVLRSHNAIVRKLPDIYKIGSTTSSVTDRIKNARNEPTYLYSGVDVVETYRCFNMGARELEDKVHSFFNDFRLNINIPDEHGVVISPREWFNIKLEAIGEAINLILKGKIEGYKYDPVAKQIVAINANTSDNDGNRNVVSITGGAIIKPDILTLSNNQNEPLYNMLVADTRKNEKAPSTNPSIRLWTGVFINESINKEKMVTAIQSVFNHIFANVLESTNRNSRQSVIIYNVEFTSKDFVISLYFLFVKYGLSPWKINVSAYQAFMSDCIGANNVLSVQSYARTFKLQQAYKCGLHELSRDMVASKDGNEMFMNMEEYIYWIKHLNALETEVNNNNYLNSLFSKNQN